MPKLAACPQPGHTGFCQRWDVLWRCMEPVGGRGRAKPAPVGQGLSAPRPLEPSHVRAGAHAPASVTENRWKARVYRSFHRLRSEIAVRYYCTALSFSETIFISFIFLAGNRVCIDLTIQVFAKDHGRIEISFASPYTSGTSIFRHTQKHSSSNNICFIVSKVSIASTSGCLSRIERV